MNSRKILITFLLMVLSTTIAYAKKQPKYEPVQPLTPEQQALVQKAIGQEKTLINNIRQRTPLVETYIQDNRPDDKLAQVPVADTYMLSRVDFGKVFYNKAYQPRSEDKKGVWFNGSLASIANLSKALGLDTKFTYSPTGFMHMMFVDPSGFDTQHYQFRYVHREFLGTVRTWVFDVHPTVSGMGRFYGRVWIEDEDANIVRFNGAFTPPISEDSSKHYFHFDSWRMNLQPGIWLPVAVYVEEKQRIQGEKTVGLKAQTHFWGYSLKLPTHESENVSMKVEDAEDKSDDSQDVSPLQASREWVTQAENNVIDRLVEAGLVAPLTPNGFETTVLDQIVTNLVVPSNIPLPSPVHCRVMLTNTVESTTVGNTILISKGLIDTMPRSEVTIASVIAMQLANIALGHHIETRYAFNDRLMFPDESTFQRIDMNHSDSDNEESVKKAQEYLQASMYKDQLPTAGLFWAQLADRGKVLKALISPRLGDSLLRADGTPWMLALARSAPRLNWDDLTQIPALPLGSWLKTDPWDDRVHQLNAKMYAPLTPRDKMPLEVTPLSYKLQRFSASNNSLTPPSDQPVSGDPNGSPAPTATPSQGTMPSSSVQPTAGDSSVKPRQPAEPVAQLGATRLGP
jgi:hypothetical protein